MKKRLRKKLRTGEFSIVSFPIDFNAPEPHDIFEDEFLGLLDSLDLGFAGELVNGSYDGEIWIFPSRPNKNPCARREFVVCIPRIDDFRIELVKSWLEKCGVVNQTIGNPFRI